MFEDLIWHGEDIVRRLEAERSLNAIDRMSYPDDQRVPIAEAEAWRIEVERRIKAESSEYVLSRYHILEQQLTKEIHEQVDTELDRWTRWYRRVVDLLKDLQRRYDKEKRTSLPDSPVVQPGTDDHASDVVAGLSNHVKSTKYDVALSFAGEDRALVGRLAELLRTRSIRVFYDEYEKARLWGKDLYQHLTDVYRQEARYCVIFLSASYRDKLWTNHELKSAQARAFSESKEYILPVRLDDSEIPGILTTAGYIDMRSTDIEELADLLQAKLHESA